ncbi:unnamed protein product, partial [Ilex paraguariensis]
APSVTAPSVPNATIPDMHIDPLPTTSCIITPGALIPLRLACTTITCSPTQDALRLMPKATASSTLTVSMLTCPDIAYLLIDIGDSSYLPSFNYVTRQLSLVTNLGINSLASLHLSPLFDISPVIFSQD